MASNTAVSIAVVRIAAGGVQVLEVEERVGFGNWRGISAWSMVKEELI